MLFNKLKKHIWLNIIVIFPLLVSLPIEGQKLKIELKEVLNLANKGSLDAFRAKRQYAIDYWEYKSFKTQFLPRVDLNVLPLTYNRSLVQRFDPINNIDVYRPQQSLNSFSEISISQNIISTGTRIFINSNFNRLINYQDTRIDNYSTTPFQIGISQPLMAFNELKWLSKTALLEYQKAKKEFIYSQQEINLKTLKLFFEWALSNKKVTIAKETKVNAERLYEIAKKRYDIGSIEKDDLLNLELESFTAKTNLAREIQELGTIVADLKLFLNKDDIENYEPELPVLISKLKIDLVEAENYMNSNNPDLLSSTIEKINAEKELDKAIKENRFDLSVNARYGLNQQASTLAEAYRNFLDQQIVSVSFRIPLLDWGERKGKIKTAKMTKELADITIQQTVNDIKRQLTLKVKNFNLQEEQVNVALKTKEISRESYTITEKRFLSGKVDLLRLLNSRQAWQTSEEQYIQSLQLYWNYYYEVQQLTLYDFLSDETLNDTFEKTLRKKLRYINDY